MKKIFLLIFMISLSKFLFAFGAFNLMNGRNHPELKWQEIQSKHIEIVYSDSLEEIANQAINIAEATYTSLSKSYDVEPNKKVVIYISDQDEIVNGATVMNDYIFVYVNQNDFMKLFSGRDKFLRKVISHEMSHYFLFTATASWITKFIPVIPENQIPLFINEGFAQFFSGEEWEINRGDRYLRNAIFSKNLNVDAGNLDSGRLLYAKGFSMVRYLYTFYGEAKIQKWLKYRNQAKIFGFKKGFKKVFDKSFDSFLKEWENYVSTYYFGEAYDLKNKYRDNNSKDLTLNAIKTIAKPLAKIYKIKAFNDNQYLVVGKEDKNQQFAEFIYAEAKEDSLKKNKLIFKNKKVIVNTNVNNFSISQNGKYVIYNRYLRHKHGSIKPTIILFDRKKNKNFEIATGNYPQILNDKTIFYQSHNLKNNFIKKYKAGKISNFLSLSIKNNIGQISVNESQNKLAVAIFDDKNQFKLDIFELDSAKLISEKILDYFPLKIDWLNDGSLLVVKDSKNQDESIIRINPQNGEITKYQTPPFFVDPVKYSLKNDSLKAIVIGELGRKKFQFGEINIPKFSGKSIKKSNYFTKWIEATPSSKIEWKNLNIKHTNPQNYSSIKNIKYRSSLLFPFTKSLFSEAIFSEGLGKHMIIGAVNLPYNFKSNDLYYNFTYINKCLSPTLTFSSNKFMMYSAVMNDKVYYHRFTDYSLNVGFPDLINSTPFWDLLNSVNFSYGKYEAKDKNFKYFENGKVAQAGFSTDLKYNLPYLNSEIHPIRKIYLGYKFTAGSDKILGDKTFTKQQLNSDLSIAPLFSFVKMPLLRYLNLRNISSYEKLNGDSFIQNKPGITSEEKINFNGSGISGRTFLRGYEKDAFNSGVLFGDEILSTKNETWIKLFDNIHFKIGFEKPIILIKYVGFGGWYDYLKIKNPASLNSTFGNSTEIKAMGNELKAELQILGIPFIGRYGQAYRTDKSKIDDYFELSIPFDLSKYM